MAHHKRRRPPQARAAYRMGKAWKRERNMKGRLLRPSQRRKVQPDGGSAFERAEALVLERRKRYGEPAPQ